MNFTISRKLSGGAAVVLITALAMSVVMFATPRVAMAQAGCISSLLSGLGSALRGFGGFGMTVPVTDYGNMASHAMTSAATQYVQTKEGCLDELVWIAAQMVLQSLTADVVSWINGGFQGNPAFISDPGRFFLDVGDTVAGNFIYSNSDLRFLCDPIVMGLNIRMALASNYFGAPFSATQRHSACTLSDVVDNVENARLFLNGNINTSAARGWQSWLAITQVPQNNVYGAYARAEAELSARVIGSRALNKQVADWGQGFKSMTDGLNGIIQTPGNFVASQLKDTFALQGQKAVVADELGELVSAVIGSLMNQVLSAGLSSLVGGGSGGGITASSIRNADPTQPFVTGAVPSGTNAPANQAVSNQTSQSLQSLRTLVVVPSGGGAGYIPPQNSRVSLFGLPVSASAYDKPLTEAPGNAIDGSTNTWTEIQPSGSGCSRSSWLEISLGSEPIALDEVQIENRESTASYGASSVVFTFDDNTTHEAAPVHSGSTSKVILPENLRTKRVQKVRIYGKDIWSDSCQDFLPVGKMYITEVYMFRHLKPEIDTKNVPTSITFEQASVTGFNPRDVSWITGYHYPTHNNRATMTAEEQALHVNVELRSPANTSIAPFTADNPATPADELLYKVAAPGNYKIRYAGEIPAGWLGDTFEISIVVEQPPATTPPP